LLRHLDFRPATARLVGAVLVLAAAGSSPAGAAPVPARPADAFVESVGVNVHLGFNDTAYAREDAVRRKLLELGVRYVRDGISQKRPDVYRRMRELAQLGVRTNLIVGDPLQRWDVGPLDDQLDLIERELAPAGVVASLEGPNEFDIQGQEHWSGPLRDYQRRLYEGARSRPGLANLPVLGPSLVEWDSRAELGDVSRWLDYGNVHPYPGGAAPDRNEQLEEVLSLASRNSAAKPVQATETGYHNALATDSRHLPASEQAAAVYMPRLYLDYFRRGIARTYAYELVDEWPDPGRADRESAFGLLRNDFSEKPAYVGLERLLALLSDRGPQFDAAPLDYRLEGAGPSVRQLLLQKRDGRHYLVLWRAVSVWDPAARQAATAGSETVRLTLAGPAARVNVYRPNEASAPVQLHAGEGPVAIAVGPEVTVVEIGSPIAARRAFRAPCRASRASRLVGPRRLRLLRSHERRLARLLLRPSCAAVRPKRRMRAERWLRSRARRINRRAHRTGWRRHHRGVRHRVIRTVVRRS
jgi:hypothetical protein